MSDEEQQSAAEETPPIVEERWAYGGRRLQSDKTVGYAWIDDEGRGEEHQFNRNYKAVIGYVYTRQVARYPDGRMTVYGEPKIVGNTWDGPERTDDRRPEWQAKDAAVAQFLSHKRLENVAAKEVTDLDKLIEPLLAVAMKLRTTSERDAMTAYVLNRMSKVWYHRGEGRR